MSLTARPLRHAAAAILALVVLANLSAADAQPVTTPPSPLPSALRAGLSVLPIRLILGSNAATGSITVVNGTADPVQFQVSGFKWDETEGGQPVLSASSVLVFYPTIFSLPPDSTQVIRVGVLGASTSTERTFRIYVEQLPSAQTRRARAADVAFRTRFGVPVFVQPENAGPRLLLSGAAIRGTELSFHVRDAGNGHDLVGEIVATGEGQNGARTFSAKGQGWYVLAGHERIFTVAVPRSACAASRSVRIDLTSDAGSTVDTLPLQGTCR